MKSVLTYTCAAELALCALAPPQMPFAQDCFEQAYFSGATVYALPLLGDAFMNRCSSELSATGFMATQGEAFLEPYRARQDANWPATLRILQLFGDRGSGPDGLSELVNSLPESALRPFVDAVIGTMVIKEIKLEDCAKIERGVELLSPLPPENVGGLMSFLMDMAGVKNPEICPYRGDGVE